jgi:ABC-2 type transport system permease protein
MLSQLEGVANRRLEVEKVNIEDQKRKKIQESKADMEQQVRQIQNRIRTLAIALPPLPALVLGFFVFGSRLRRENQGANPNRLA